MVKPSAFDVSEQSYGKFGRIYSLNYLQNNSQNYWIYPQRRSYWLLSVESLKYCK